MLGHCRRVSPQPRRTNSPDRGRAWRIYQALLVLSSSVGIRRSFSATSAVQLDNPNLQLLQTLQRHDLGNRHDMIISARRNLPDHTPANREPEWLGWKLHLLSPGASHETLRRNTSQALPCADTGHHKGTVIGPIGTSVHIYYRFSLRIPLDFWPSRQKGGRHEVRPHRLIHDGSGSVDTGPGLVPRYRICTDS